MLVLIEHINFSMLPLNMEWADCFYLKGLGCMRDSRSTRSIHANLGLSQFHLTPQGSVNQLIHGRIGLFVPSLTQLKVQLDSITSELQGTCFQYGLEKIPASLPWPYAVEETGMEIKSPNGNVFHAFQTPDGYADAAKGRGRHPTAPSFGDGVFLIELYVPMGTLPGIARFYTQYFDTVPVVTDASCTVPCGELQFLNFVETNQVIPPYSGYHICLYVDDIQAAYTRVSNDDLHFTNPLFSDKCSTLEEVQEGQQFRVLNVVDPLTKKTLFQLEHEVRSLSHERCPLGKK